MSVGDQRGAYYVQAVSNGWMTINEIRSRENLPPILGSDSARVPMNTEALAPSAAPDPADETQGRRAAMLGAHRALLVDVLGRIIRRFVEKAKRASATPQKLRVCADNFFTDEHHITMSVDQLEPSVRAWLTYIDSDVLPSVAGAAIARQLNATYHREITELVDGCVVTDQAYHDALHAMLYRWERYGAEEIVDSILRHGIGA